MTNMTLEVFGLLMHNQNLFIVEFPVAIPAPGLLNLLLLATHRKSGVLVCLF